MRNRLVSEQILTILRDPARALCENLGNGVGEHCDHP